MQISDGVRAVRRAFDQRAPVYDEDRMHRAVASATADFISLDGVETVLDVATGTGLLLRAVHARDPGLRLVGVDISPGMLAVARTTLPEADWIESDAAALPIGDASVDLVTCVTALHLISDLTGVFAEWRRVLRPGGHAVTATFLQRAGQAFLSAPTPERPYTRNHVPFASIETMTRTAEGFGFTLARHMLWYGEYDTVLLSELVPRATTPCL